MARRSIPLLVVACVMAVLSQRTQKSDEEMKRHNMMGSNSMKFIVSEDAISNCKYILYRKPMTYAKAAAQCALLKDSDSGTGRGRIAVVRNKGDNEELTSLLQHAFGYKLKVSYARKTDWIWIGQTLIRNGKWVDQEGEQVKYTSWESGQPDARVDGEKEQLNIRLGKHGLWDDTFADKLHPFVCTHTEHFVYSTSKVTWDRAVDYCSWGGMTLAHLISPEENIAVVQMAREKSPVDALGGKHPYLNRNWLWIGASDNHTEGVWRWSRGTKIYYRNWEKSQPDNLEEDYLDNTVTDGQHFASISKITGGWDDSFSTRLREYVCMCAEHNFDLDETTLDEELQDMYQNQTESWNALKEQISKEEEITPDSPPPECASEKYFAYTERLTWFAAKSKCESRGMTLAKVNSLKANYDATRQMFKADPIDMSSMKQYYSDDNWFWVGLSDYHREGKFVWTDGSAIDYDNWGSQQPDNIRVSDFSITGQHFVAVHKLLRFWDDSGDRQLPFLCQCPGYENVEEPDMSATSEVPTDSAGPIVQASTSKVGGKRFIYYWGRTTFWDAQSRCVNAGGNLACPSNSKQNEFIASIIRSNSWLGVLDYNREGEFLCANSDRITYDNWGDKQPDNKGDGRDEADFVVMAYGPGGVNHGKWEDTGTMTFLMDYKNAYVCESACEEGEDGCIPNDPAKAS